MFFNEIRTITVPHICHEFWKKEVHKVNINKLKTYSSEKYLECVINRIISSILKMSLLLLLDLISLKVYSSDLENISRDSLMVELFASGDKFIYSGLAKFVVIFWTVLGSIELC